MELTAGGVAVVSELHRDRKFHLHCPDTSYEADFDLLFTCQPSYPPTDGFQVETDLGKRTTMIDKAWNQVKNDVVYLPIHHQVIAWGMADKLNMPIVPNDSPNFYWARMK